MVNARNEKQREVSKIWLDSSRIGTLVLGTGFGKSKVTMDIMGELFKSGELTQSSKILLLADSEKLRDDNWKDDFKKWNVEWMWEHVQAECYQTAYKWENTEWDLVIADEIDFGLTEEYSKVFAKNKFKMVLGLTGYIDPAKKELVELIAPVLITYTTQDAQADGILNSTQVVFVEYDLSRNPHDVIIEYVVGGKKKSFKQSENDAYAYLEDKCNVYYGMITNLESDPDIAFGLDRVKVSKLNQLKAKYKRYIMQRKIALFGGIAAKVKAKELIAKILEKPSNKVLTFSMYTDQADAITHNTYHGKNKKDNTSLEDLNSGNIRAVGVCKAVNRGINLVGVNNIIMESYEGSKTAFHQRHGRGMRLLPDQKLYLYIMLPYYYKKIQSPENPHDTVEVRRPTQMVKWAENMLADFDLGTPLRIKL